jgi:hypothetical protein
MDSLSSPENVFHWSAAYGITHTTVEILIFRPTHSAYGNSNFLVLGKPIKYNVHIREWRRSEAVCTKSVTGDRRISWERNCLSVCLSVGFGQMVVSKKSASETILDARGFRFFLYSWDSAWGFFCVCSAYAAVSIPKYTASILWRLVDEELQRIWKAAVVGVCMFL